MTTSRGWLGLAVASLLALVAQRAPAAGQVRLLSGTPVLLQLQHHITSAYTAAGSAIRFRVAKDVEGDGGLAISAGTPVEGRMRQTTDRASLGTPGSMVFSIDFVPAVDGQRIRVIASESRRGRDRGNALAGWTIFWGLPGLMTRGVHGWLERGATVEALVLHDRRIGPAIPAAAVGGQPVPAPPRGRIEAHRFSGSRARPVRVDFERDKPLGTVEFTIAGVAGDEIRGPGEDSWSLVAVDDLLLDAPVPALSAGGSRVTFDSWSILQYCRHGATALRFAHRETGEAAAEFEYLLDVEFTGRK